MSISTRLPPESPPAGERAPGANSPGERERLMADLFIAYSDRHFRSMPSREYLEDPDESQRALMATLGITFQDGVYRLGAFQYDRLADAVSYARLQLQSPGPV